MGKHGYALEYGGKLPFYLEFMATLETDSTKESYRYALGRWAMFLSDIPEVQPDNAKTWTDELPGVFYEYLDGQGKNWSTLNVYMAAVMQYLWFIELYDALPFEVTDAKKKLKRVKDTIGL